MHYALWVVAEKGNYVLEFNCFHQPERNMFSRAFQGPCGTVHSNRNSHLFDFVSFRSAPNESVVLRKMSWINVKVPSFTFSKNTKKKRWRSCPPKGNFEIFSSPWNYAYVLYVWSNYCKENFTVLSVAEKRGWNKWKYVIVPFLRLSCQSDERMITTLCTFCKFVFFSIY